MSSKILSLVAVFLLSGVLSAAVVSEKSIPVKNANFAEAKNNAPVGWDASPNLTVTTGKDGDVTFVTLKADKDLGYPNISQGVLQAKDLPALKEGESYEFALSFRQKSTGVEKRAFGGVGLLAKGKRLAYVDSKNIPGTSDWQNVSATLTKFPEGVESIRIFFYLNGAGSVSFTDVKLIVKVVDKK